MKSLVALLVCSSLAAGPVRVYVANSGGDNLTIIDPVTNKVTGEIKVSKNPHGLVFSPDRSRIYVSSEGDNVLDVVDRMTNQVVKRVPIGTRPNNIAMTPDGRRIYICIRQESWVDIVDTASLEKEKSVPVGRYPHNVYCTKDGRHMIATSLGDNKVTVIDVNTEEPEFDIPVGGIPRPLAIDSGTEGEPKRLFVQLSNFNGFEVIDYAARKITARIPMPDAPPGAQPLVPTTFAHGIGIAPDGKTLWVNSMLANTVSVFSMANLKRLATIPVGNGPDWIAFLPDGSRCYVSNAGADSVSVLDIVARKELLKIPVGKTPKRLVAVELPEPLSAIPPKSRKGSGQ